MNAYEIAGLASSALALAVMITAAVIDTRRRYQRIRQLTAELEAIKHRRRS